MLNPANQMSKKLHQIVDYVGQWFQAYREIGEPFEIYFDIESKGQTKRLAVDHAKHDGIGALHEISKANNWKISTVGANKPPPQIGRFKLVINLLLFFYWTRSRKNKWNFEITKVEKDFLKISRHVFTELETTQLKEKSTRLKVSLNSYLFYHFNLTLNHFFTPSDRTWWMPVNMRPDLGLNTNNPELNKNYASNFTIDFDKSFNLQDTHHEIKTCLKQQRHWATWWWQLLGRYLNYDLIKATAIKGLDNPYTGAFSNLGEWTCSEQNSNLTVYINTLKSHPVGVGAIIWNGRLNLSLRLYPSFPLQQTDLDQLMQSWKKSLFGFDSF